MQPGFGIKSLSGEALAVVQAQAVLVGVCVGQGFAERLAIPCPNSFAIGVGDDTRGVDLVGVDAVNIAVLDDCYGRIAEVDGFGCLLCYAVLVGLGVFTDNPVIIPCVQGRSRWGDFLHPLVIGVVAIGGCAIHTGKAVLGVVGVAV